MMPIDVVDDAEDARAGPGDAHTGTGDAALVASGQDVDPVPIGDPDEDEGYDDDEDDDEEEDEDEEPLQCAGHDRPPAGVRRVR